MGLCFHWNKLTDPKQLSSFTASTYIYIYIGIYRCFPGVSEIMSYLTWSWRLHTKAECVFLPSLTLLQSWTSLTFPHLLLSARSSRLSLASFSPLNSPLTTSVSIEAAFANLLPSQLLQGHQPQCSGILWSQCFNSEVSDCGSSMGKMFPLVNRKRMDGLKGGCVNWLLSHAITQYSLQLEACCEWLL